MIYEIVELSTERESGRTYLLVHFWPDKRKIEPYLINDFIWTFRPDEDVEPQIAEMVEQYWARAQTHGWEGDHSASEAAPTRPFKEGGKTIRAARQPVERTFQRHDADPDGILAKAKHLVKK